jgi:hypothetical protein
MSHDLEDIVTAVHGRSELVDEARLSPADLQQFLSDQFRDYYRIATFSKRYPAISCPMPPASNAQAWSLNECDNSFSGADPCLSSKSAT